MRHYNHPYRETADVGGLFRDLLLWTALGALVVGSWRACSRTHRARLAAKPQPLPRKLQTWEGEGGRPDPEDHEQDPPTAATPPRGASRGF